MAASRGDAGRSAVGRGRRVLMLMMMMMMVMKTVNNDDDNDNNYRACVHIIILR